MEVIEKRPLPGGASNGNERMGERTHSTGQRAAEPLDVRSLCVWTAQGKGTMHRSIEMLYFFFFFQKRYTYLGDEVCAVNQDSCNWLSLDYMLMAHKQ